MAAARQNLHKTMSDRFSWLSLTTSAKLNITHCHLCSAKITLICAHTDLKSLVQRNAGINIDHPSECKSAALKTHYFKSLFRGSFSRALPNLPLPSGFGTTQLSGMYGMVIVLTASARREDLWNLCTSSVCETAGDCQHFHYFPINGPGTLSGRQSSV